MPLFRPLSFEAALQSLGRSVNSASLGRSACMLLSQAVSPVDDFARPFEPPRCAGSDARWKCPSPACDGPRAGIEPDRARRGYWIDQRPRRCRHERGGWPATPDLLRHRSRRTALGSRWLNPLQRIPDALSGRAPFGLVSAYIARKRGSEVDPIEANALHGGRMSLRGSLIVAGQTVWSSGIGASVGWRRVIPSFRPASRRCVGQGFRLRRRDLRILVGCGAARPLRRLRRTAWPARSMRSNS